MERVGGDVPEERYDIGDAVLVSLQHLERIARDVDRVALLYPVSIEDRRVRPEAVGEDSATESRLSTH